MRDGVHIPPAVVWGAAIAVVAALAALAKNQFPEARRYMKMERM